MNNILQVVSMSGGKDSTATTLIALEKHPTGNPYLDLCLWIRQL